MTKYIIISTGGGAEGAEGYEAAPEEVAEVLDGDREFALRYKGEHCRQALLEKSVLGVTPHILALEDLHPKSHNL